jgi:hypothetical protein
MTVIAGATSLPGMGDTLTHIVSTLRQSATISVTAFSPVPIGRHRVMKIQHEGMFFDCVVFLSLH